MLLRQAFNMICHMPCHMAFGHFRWPWMVNWYLIFEGHSPVARLFKCRSLNICAAVYKISTGTHVSQSLCNSWASCHLKMCTPSEKLHFQLLWWVSSLLAKPLISYCSIDFAGLSLSRVHWTAALLSWWFCNRSHHHCQHSANCYNTCLFHSQQHFRMNTFYE